MDTAPISGDDGWEPCNVAIRLGASTLPQTLASVALAVIVSISLVWDRSPKNALWA